MKTERREGYGLSIYTYIYIERERKRDIDFYVYIYRERETYLSIHIYGAFIAPQRLPMRSGVRSDNAHIRPMPHVARRGCLLHTNVNSPPQADWQSVRQLACLQKLKASLAWSAPITAQAVTPTRTPRPVDAFHATRPRTYKSLRHVLTSVSARSFVPRSAVFFLPSNFLSLKILRST